MRSREQRWMDTGTDVRLVSHRLAGRTECLRRGPVVCQPSLGARTSLTRRVSALCTLRGEASAPTPRLAAHASQAPSRPARRVKLLAEPCASQAPFAAVAVRLAIAVYIPLHPQISGRAHRRVGVPAGQTSCSRKAVVTSIRLAGKQQPGITTRGYLRIGGSGPYPSLKKGYT